jgi:hypothetical protein
MDVQLVEQNSLMAQEQLHIFATGLRVHQELQALQVQLEQLVRRGQLVRLALDLAEHLVMVKEK